MVTTIEHRQAAALAILADARGPLTVRGVRERMRALGHGVETPAARHALERLVGAGYAERMIYAGQSLAGNRIYWPTQDGRIAAETLEAQRIDGV